MKMTIREVRRKYSGLDALSHRSLAERSSELKVATLLRMYFGQPFQVSEDLINKAIQDLPVPEEFDDVGMPIRLRDARGLATESVQNMEIEVRDVPDHLKIKAIDLPKVSKHLEQNQMGVANIIASLGPELYDDFDEAEEKAFLEAPPTPVPTKKTDAVQPHE